MTSKESSIQPRPAATTVRRWAEDVLFQRKGRSAVEASKTLGCHLAAPLFLARFGFGNLSPSSPSWIVRQ